MDERRFGRWFCAMLSVAYTCSWGAADYSATTHQIAAGDFNGDRRADLLVIARDPWRSSGILLGETAGLPTHLHQSWRSDHLGLDWSGERFLPVIGSFSQGKCTAGHMGSSCVYPQDLLLQSAQPGTSALLFVDHARTVFDQVQQSVPNTYMGLGWSAEEHRLVVGHFDSDNYHDLFFQAKNATGENALVITTSLDGFPANARPRQAWSGEYAGLPWSADAAEVVAGDFTGDGFDDLLSQARTPADQPYAPATFGILAGGSNGFSAADGSEPEAWLSWSRFGFFVPDWSATEYRALVGNFNNDAYDDILLQPRHAGSPGYIILFGPRDDLAAWTVLRLPPRPAGWHLDSVELLLADFDGDGRDQIYLQPVLPGGKAEVADVGLRSTSGEAELTYRAPELPALDIEPDTENPQPGTAVGLIPGGFAVDATGAATYRLPLRVPPGVRGMQPDLALVYHHRAGDQWLGEGWSISGLPQIRRCGTVAEPAADGFADGADLDANDRYCLDGQRLVETDTPGEYRTEIDSRRRIRSYGRAGSGPAYFMVEDAGGLRWEFGRTEDSRLRPRGQRVAESILAYAVNRVTDRYGNAIDYRYVQDSDTTAMRPDQVSWLNADGVVVGRLWFRFVRRKDIRRGWLQGYRASVPWRLKRIDTETRSRAGNFAPVRSYHLDYRYSEISGRAYLNAVNECEQSAGLCLGQTSFAWEPGRRGFVPKPDTTSVRYQDRAGLMLLDVDGNGVSDYVYLRRDSATQSRWVVRKDSIDGAVLSSLPAVDWDESIIAPVGYRAIPGDFNGDGFADLLQPTDSRDDPGTRIRMLKGGVTGLTGRSTSLPILGRNLWEAGIGADIDGDGRTDLVTSSGTKLLAFRSTGENFDPDPWQAEVPGEAPARRLLGQTGELVRPVVFDADGRADLLALAADCETAPWVGVVCWNYQWAVYSLSDPVAGGNGALTVVHTLPPGDYIAHLKLLDVNDDGLTDLLFQHKQNSRWELHVATGTGYKLQWSAASLQLPELDDAAGGPDGFTRQEQPALPPSSAFVSLDADTLRYAQVIDYNHDGYDDLLIADPADAGLAALLADPISGGLGAALVRTGIAAPGLEHRRFLKAADTGGDGQPDLLLPDSSDRYQVFHARGTSRGLLRAVTDGLGATTSVAYGLLRDQDLHQYGDSQFPYSRYTGPMYLVRETATPTGLESADRVLTRYEYLGAQVHRQGRGFVGFSERRAWNVNRQLSTVNRYAQAFPLTGQVLQSEQRLGDALEAPELVSYHVPDFGLFEYPAACDTDAGLEECLQLFRQGTPGTLDLLRGKRFNLSTTQFVVRESGPNGRIRLPIAAEVEELSYPVSSEGAVGSVLKRRIVTTYHSELHPVDDFGNPERIIVQIGDGRGSATRRVEVVSEWENRVGDWCIGLQRSAVVTSYESETAGTPRSRRYAYDQRCALLEEETLPEDQSFRKIRRLEYDGFGNVSSESLNGQSFQRRETSAEYGADYHGRFLTAEENALGHRRMFSWDERFGAPLAEWQSGPQHAPVSRTAVRLDGFGRLIAQSAPDSLARAEYTRTWCDGGCRSPLAVTLRTTLRSDGQLETVERDALGRIVHSTRLGFDGETINTATHYDSLGRNYAISLPYLDSDSARRCYSLQQHDALFRVLAVSRAAGDTECRFAAAPLPSDTLAGSGQRLAFLYDLPDANGWKRQVLLQTPGRPDLLRTEIHDPLGRVQSVAEQGGDIDARITLRYTPDGNLEEIVAADGSMTRFEYNPLGLASRMEDSSLGSRWYGYNALGELIVEQDGDGTLIRYLYDVVGRLERRIDRWNLFSSNDPRQQVTDFHYDNGSGFGLGRLATATGPYPAGGPVPDSTPRISYHYDDRGRVRHRQHYVEIDGRGRDFWVSQSFDDDGRLSELTYPSVADDGSASQPGDRRLRIAYRHNSRGYLSAVERIDNPGQLWSAQAVDAGGRFVRTHQLGDELVTSRVFDRATGLMTGTEVRQAGQAVQHLLYDWTPDGLLRTREDLVTDQREEFEHDALGRLVNVKAFAAGGPVGERHFDYDAGGNPVLGTLLDDSRPQRVLRAGDDSTSYEYDGSGRVVRRGGFELDRGPSGLLRSIETGSGSIELRYGPHRQRTRRIDQRGDSRVGVTYIGQTTRRLDGARSTYQQRVMVGREAVAIVEGSPVASDRVSFLHRDYAGSTTAVTADGETRRYAYDHAGRARDPMSTLPVVDAAGLPVPDAVLESAGGFAGQEHLADTGLIHMNGRVLDAGSKRFLSADPYIQRPNSSQDLNRYSYGLNGYIGAVDPSGYSLRRFFRRLAKRLFFDAPFLLLGIPGGELFGVSIGFSVGGFMPYGGQATPPVPAPVANGSSGDIFAVRREQLILSATDGARLASEAPGKLVAWRIREALEGGHIGLSSGTDGVNLESSLKQLGTIGERTTGLLGPELDSRELREPGRVFITAHRIGEVGPIHTAIEYRDELGVYWLSAGPEGYSLEGYRALVGGVGTARNGQRQTDAPWKNAVLAEVRPPPGVSRQAYFGQLREAAERFCNCVDYDLFPTLGGGYNSNGYVRGLINATGGRTDFDFTQLIGGAYPVPPEYFGY